jgi:hypothetical protein
LALPKKAFNGGYLIVFVSYFLNLNAFLLGNFDKVGFRNGTCISTNFSSELANVGVRAPGLFYYQQSHVLSCNWAIDKGLDPFHWPK